MEADNFRLLLAIILIFLSALFAGSETAIFSIKRMSIKELETKGGKIAQKILSFRKNPHHTLISILTGNELVNIGFSAIMAVLTLHLGIQNRTVSIILTALLVLLLGEITPKSIALSFPVNFARVVAWPLSIWYKLVTPIRVILEKGANLFSNLWSKGELETDSQKLDEDAVLHLIEEGQKEGVIEDIEVDLIKRVLDLEDVLIMNIMTPREKIFYLTEDMKLEDIHEKLKHRHFSRVPVVNKSGEFIGVFYTRDLLPYVKNKQDFPGLTKLMRPPLFVPTKKRAYDLLREFKVKNAHMALAVNEYGEVVGLVTLDNILSTLFGLERVPTG